MKILSRPFAAAMVLAVAATPAWAEDPQIEIDQSVYSYTKTAIDTRPTAGVANSSTDEGFATMPPDLEIDLRMEQWEFAVFPTTPGGASFEVLNLLVPHFSVGLDFGDQRIDHSDQNYTRKSETIEAGPMAEWDPLYGDQAVELTLILNYEQATGSATTKNPSFSLQDNGIPASTVSSRGYASQLQAYFVQRVTDNVKVAVGGIYTYGWMHDKVANANNVTSAVELIPLQLRADIY